ncbi:MAG: hypothetical protein J6K42_04685 [Clostridia bacterium]|nr:hypothetical protein [Clostridia bacterium]
MEEKNIEKKDVEKKDVENKDVEKKSMNPKTKKIITFSVIGGVALIVLVIVIALIVGMLGKPSKRKSEELVKSYLKAVEEADGDKFEKLIDTRGYIIFQEEGEKKFDAKYKDKDKYIKKYLKDKNYDDISDATDSIVSSFKSKNSYYYSSKEYTLKEMTSVKKSNRSKKIVEIKAKVKVKRSSSSSSDTKNLKLYVIKVDGEYKIIGAELES